jgi:hypothetical protein
MRRLTFGSGLATMQKTIPSFGDLVMRHKGARICVMGGGPSLVSDLEKVEADIWISVNEHGAKVRPVDYVVAMDDIHTKLHVPMLKHIRAVTDAPIITPWFWGDYQIMKWPRQPKFVLSGVAASWVAAMMGAHPVILAGFDCYGGHGATVGQHRDYVPHVHAQVRVCSGPLTAFYPAYTGEPLGPYVIPDALDLDALTKGEIVVEALKPFVYGGREWPKGTRLRVSAYEVRRQIKHKSLVEVQPDAEPEPVAEPLAPVPKKRGRPRKQVVMHGAD